MASLDPTRSQAEHDPDNEMFVLGGGRFEAPQHPSGAQSIGTSGTTASTHVDRPKCHVVMDGQQCRYDAIRKCKACDEPVCLEHSHDFISESTHPRLKEFEGYYCSDCYAPAVESYNQEVETINSELRAEKTKSDICAGIGCAGNTACKCFDWMCKNAF